MRRVEDRRRLKVGRREPSLEEMGLMGDNGDANNAGELEPYSIAIARCD